MKYFPLLKNADIYEKLLSEKIKDLYRIIAGAYY